MTNCQSVLVPMTQDEFHAWAAEKIPAYANDKVASGQWPAAEALELSRKSFDDLLPEGLATSGNHLFTIRNPQKRNVGSIWFAIQDRGGTQIAYVYDIVIKEEHRRQGHAKRAFIALEEKVKSLRLSGIALHVFGHNAAAQALYAKLGYHPTNINLFKAIGSP
jgi:ribosomal protein S18 acetylase RimI-like enzyme